MHKNNGMISMTLKSGLFVGACVLMMTTSGCEECPAGECLAESGTTQAVSTQGSGQTGVTLSSGTPSFEGTGMSTGMNSSADAESPSSTQDAKGEDKTGGSEPGSTSGAGTKSGGSSSAPDNNGDTSTESGTSSSESDSSNDTNAEPGEKDELKFEFSIPELNHTFSARVRGGKKGSSIVIDKFPESYEFRPFYTLLPLGYPDKIDETFCADIEETVEIVEKDNSVSGVARATLRESYPFVNLKFPFGTIFTTPLFIAAREAARSAGAISNNLQIANGPEFQDVKLAVTFTKDSLTRRMGDHEKARKELLSQLDQGASMLPDTGAYLGGSNWPDLLCDLYSKQAQMTLTIKEKGWTSVVQSQTLVQTR